MSPWVRPVAPDAHSTPCSPAADGDVTPRNFLDRRNARDRIPQEAAVSRWHTPSSAASGRYRSGVARSLCVRWSVVCLIVFSAGIPCTVWAESPDPGTSADTSGAQCFPAEQQWADRLVAMRDRGVAEDEMLDSVERIARTPASAQVIRARIRDVYLDTRLTGLTIGVYRTAKCLDGLDSADWSAARAEVSRGLLACQAGSDGTVRSFSPCVVDLIDRIRAQSPGGSDGADPAPELSQVPQP